MNVSELSWWKWRALDGRMIIPVTCRSVDKLIFVEGSPVLISVLPSRLLSGASTASQPAQQLHRYPAAFTFSFPDGKLSVYAEESESSRCTKVRGQKLHRLL